MSIRHLLFTLALLHGVAHAAKPEIVFIAPTNHTMPLAEFVGDKLQRGILKDLGEAIAERLGLHARFLALPSKRVSAALRAGDADGVCYVLPNWIEGEFNWSQPVIPNSGIIATRLDTPSIGSIQALSDLTIGTVLGYQYPQFDPVLGSHFKREDAPTMESNLQKLAMGRMDYAIVEQNTLDYHNSRVPQHRLKQALVFASFKAQCAFSQKSTVPFADIKLAIDALLLDKSIEKILARYR
ncbi:MAG: transporter substrate-binding domain-containing protein [Pseudomonadota bacterium]